MCAEVNVHSDQNLLTKQTSTTPQLILRHTKLLCNHVMLSNLLCHGNHGAMVTLAVSSLESQGSAVASPVLTDPAGDTGYLF